MTQRYVQRRGANHGLHIVLTVLTCGLWAITGWPIAAAMGRKTVTTIPAPPPPPGPYPPQQPYQAPPFYGQQPPPPQQGWPPHQ
jgi:hypothetical protein